MIALPLRQLAEQIATLERQNAVLLGTCKLLIDRIDRGTVTADALDFARDAIRTVEPVADAGQIVTQAQAIDGCLAALDGRAGVERRDAGTLADANLRIVLASAADDAPLPDDDVLDALDAEPAD